MSEFENGEEFSDDFIYEDSVPSKEELALWLVYDTLDILHRKIISDELRRVL